MPSAYEYARLVQALTERGYAHWLPAVTELPLPYPDGDLHTAVWVRRRGRKVWRALILHPGPHSSRYMYTCDVPRPRDRREYDCAAPSWFDTLAAAVVHAVDHAARRHGLSPYRETD